MLGQGAAAAIGLRGVLLTLSPAGNAAGRLVNASFDYSSFANAYGANFGHRLQLVSLPGCALTTPAVRACDAQTLVPGTVNAGSAVSARLRLPGGGGGGRGTAARPTGLVVLALASQPTSAEGTFTATSLSPGYSWSAGNQGGTFSTSVPVRVPEALGGPKPDLSLSYDSGGVDAQTLSQNTQPSWVGEGWDLQTGFIEQSYRGCSDSGANFPNTPDLCLYEFYDITMVFGGRSVRLVRDATTGVWHSSDDSSLKIEELKGTGAANAPGTNGTFNHAYWRVTTLDGTQYYFGIAHRFLNDTADTLSAQWEPVYLSNSGTQCPGGARWCMQGYRWNLDYVVDNSNNSMTYFYTQMQARVGANNNTNVQSYVLTSDLDHIDYGERAGSEATTTAPARVLLTKADRCVGACAQNNTDFPDTPWDLSCVSRTNCPQTKAPVFFDPHKLTAVTTQVYAGTAYRSVDRWEMTYKFPSTGNFLNGAGDDTSPSLWLQTITHTGYAADGTTTLTDPVITLGGTLLKNRVDWSVTLGVPPLTHYRVDQVLNGMGGETDIAYNGPPCTAATVSGGLQADTNTHLCFPQYDTSPGGQPGFAWFQKYTVASVTVRDLTGGSPDEVYSYAYSMAGSSDAAAFHHDYNDSSAPAYHSWADFHGFSTVTVTHGPAGGPQTVTRSLYYRGMDGDKTVAGGYDSRRVSITNSQGAGITDSEGLRGRLLEQTQLNGAAAASSTIYGYGNILTGTRAIADGPDWRAYMVTTTRQRTRTWVAATSTWRWNQTDTGYNSYGLPTSIKELGDPAVPAQARCTSISYATPDTANWLIDFPAWKITTDCAATPGDSDYLSGVQYYYDGGALSATPSRGLVTKTMNFALAKNGVHTWALGSTAAYDANGRITHSADALGRDTQTAYTPATGGPVTAVTTTSPSPMSWTSTTNIEPGHGSVTSTADVNNKVTNAAYDPLGRLVKVWLNNRPQAGNTPDLQYTYVLSSVNPSYVQTQKLAPDGASQIPSFAIYDGQVRLRQTQAPAPVANAPAANGGRWITDTAYDGRGLAVKASSFYNSASAPAGALVTFADNAVPTQDTYSYDNLERKTADAFWSMGAQKWQTTWVFDGDRTGVIPPAGGITQQTLTNARGDTTELRQFATASLTGSYQSTKYAYDQLQRLTSVTDSQGNAWGFEYDLRGRQTKVTTPDTGATASAYDDAGQLTSTTDSAGTALYYSYDNLGRKTSVNLGSATGAQLASWTYDTLAKGQLTSSTEYPQYVTGGGAYTSAVTGYDSAYRPQGVSITIPAAEGAALAGTWTTSTGYNDDGSIKSLSYPAAGGLPAETVNYAYDANGYPLTATGADTYVAATAYQPWGDVYQRTLGAAGSQVQVTTDQWPDTHRIKTISVATQHPGSSPATFDEQLSQGYHTDPAGTVNAIDTLRAGVVTDSQCFSYDNLQRLQTAWTTTPALGGCAAAPSATTVGGPDPYWQTYAYDPGGNRTSLISHGLAGAADTTSTYHYPLPGPGAHQLTTADTAGPAGTSSNGYTYKPAGQMSNMTIAGLSTDFTYTPEGRVATATTHATGGDQKTTYLYSADGTQILRDTPSDKTLYLGGTEITTDAAGNAITGATRYYTAGGTLIASRTASGDLSWLASDALGTAQIAITQATLAVSIRKQDPFGNPRGTIPNWPNTRSFVGGTTEPTSLIHLGARMYDPVTGRFTASDPVLTPADPQQLNAYSYASNNPVTSSDPTGLCPHDKEGCPGYNPPPLPPITCDRGCEGQGGNGGGGTTTTTGGGGSTNGNGTSNRGTGAGCGLFGLNCVGHFFSDAGQGVLDVGRGVVNGFLQPFNDIGTCLTHGGFEACGDAMMAVFAAPAYAAKQLVVGAVSTVVTLHHEFTSGHAGRAIGTIATLIVAAAVTKRLLGGAAAAKATPGTTAVAADVAARRVTLRASTKQAVLAAQRAPDGKLYDPNTGLEIPEGGGHFGHRPGFEWWRTQQIAREQGWTRQQLIEYENEPSHYWYEDPSSNMSHRYEMPR